MAKNIDFMGAIFPDVPSVKLPQQGGGLVAFDDTTDATATADKILSGYTAYANGQKLVGTASGGITPSGTYSITSNGIYDITSFASVDVNVSGGGGGDAWKLLKTESLGEINVSSTSAVDLQKSIIVENINEYDVLLVVAKADNEIINRHFATISFINLHTNRSATSYDYEAQVKNAATGGGRFNFFKSGYGIGSNASSAGGIYPGTTITLSGDVDNRTITIPLYARYNSANTATINDTYTVKVYGAHLFDLM